MRVGREAPNPLRRMRASVLVTAALLIPCPGCADSQSGTPTAGATTDAGDAHDPDPPAPDAGDSHDPDPPAPDAGEAPDADAHEADAPTCKPVESNPPLGPSGYRMDGWDWTPGRVVLELPEAASGDGYLAPSAVLWNGALHVWATRKQGLVQTIVHTQSADGVVFSPPEPVQGLGTPDFATQPSVSAAPDGLRMWYVSGDVHLARSTDAAGWVTVASSVFGPGDPASFDSVLVMYPSVVRTDPGWTMLYTAFDGVDTCIGRAVSDDGTRWTRDPQGPVLRRGSSTDFDNRAVAQASIVPHGDAWLLWYGGYDTSRTDPGPYRIGHAVSSNGFEFDRQGVTIDLAEAGPEAFGTRDPSVVRWNGVWWMVYAGLGDDLRYRLLLSTSSSCGSHSG